MSTHEKLGTLAEKLEFSNALLRQSRRDLSAICVERGKDAAYIAELEARNEKLVSRTAQLENEIKSLKGNKPPRERGTIAKLEQHLKACRSSRDQLIQQLNRITTPSR